MRRCCAAVLRERRVDRSGARRRGRRHEPGDRRAHRHGAAARCCRDAARDRSSERSVPGVGRAYGQGSRRCCGAGTTSCSRTSTTSRR
jgi:hypothetical protein